LGAARLAEAFSREARPDGVRARGRGKKRGRGGGAGEGAWLASRSRWRRRRTRRLTGSLASKDLKRLLRSFGWNLELNLQQHLIELIRQRETEAALEFAQSQLAEQGEESRECLTEMERTLALLAFDNRRNPLLEICST
ncbi:hypothetical protein E2320_009533, partial [Naja naja]